MKTLIQNAHLISPDLELHNAFVLIDDKQIFSISQTPPAEKPDKIFNAEGNMLVPGFIDTHVHGRSNFDFCDGNMAAITAIANGKICEGVTSFLPTTLTVSEEQLTAAFCSAAAYMRCPTGAKILGIHLEGPFINPKCLGAQNPKFVQMPNIELIRRLNAIFPVKKVSFAPELSGADTLTTQLLEMNITPSCVHSAASYHDYAKLIPLGMCNLSHFCNQMSPLHHRDIGLVGAGLLHDDTFCEIICDKLHLCPEMIQLIFKFKPAERLLLITDAMRAAAMPDGKYDLGGVEVFVKNGEARLAAGNLAGSTLQLCNALKNTAEITNIPLPKLIAASSYTQALSLHIPNLGKIQAGFTADLTILNANSSPRAVFLDGILL